MTIIMRILLRMLYREILLLDLLRGAGIADGLNLRENAIKDIADIDTHEKKAAEIKNKLADYKKAVAPKKSKRGKNG